MKNIVAVLIFVVTSFSFAQNPAEQAVMDYLDDQGLEYVSVQQNDAEAVFVFLKGRVLTEEARTVADAVNEVVKQHAGTYRAASVVIYYTPIPETNPVAYAASVSPGVVGHYLRKFLPLTSFIWSQREGEGRFSLNGIDAVAEFNLSPTAPTPHPRPMTGQSYQPSRPSLVNTCTYSSNAHGSTYTCYNSEGVQEYRQVCTTSYIGGTYTSRCTTW